MILRHSELVASSLCRLEGSCSLVPAFHSAQRPLQASSTVSVPSIGRAAVRASALAPHKAQPWQIGCAAEIWASSAGITHGQRLYPRCRHTGQCRRRSRCTRALQIDNQELVTGDVLVLVAFCLYKQITAIILNPAFPGWTAPLRFNPDRFEEFASFAVTVCCAWVVSSVLVDGYSLRSTADIPSALRRVSLAWLVSMPVAACQLVLTTAAESHALVGEVSFAAHLPLAASGPGEPLATAAGILGAMALWRTYYTTSLDYWNFRTLRGSRVDRSRDLAHLGATLRSTALITLGASIIIQILDYAAGNPNIVSFIRQVFGVSEPLL